MNKTCSLLCSLITILLVFLACSPPELKESVRKPATIDSYESCVRAGYAVTKSFPPGCHAPGGEVFYRETDGDVPTLAKENNNKIKTFEECVAAGNAVLKVYPPRCVANGIVYTKAVPDSGANGGSLIGARCKNLCGNGKCEEIVCMAIGCPCAETAESCPQDCK